MIRRWNRHFTETDISVILLKDEVSHNIPLSQNLIQSKTLTLHNAVKAERDNEAVGKKKNVALKNVDLWDLKKEYVSITFKYKMKQQMLM